VPVPWHRELLIRKYFIQIKIKHEQIIFHVIVYAAYNHLHKRMPHFPSKGNFSKVKTGVVYFYLILVNQRQLTREKAKLSMAIFNFKGKAGEPQIKVAVDIKNKKERLFQVLPRSSHY
jgi:hypothetical protein